MAKKKNFDYDDLKNQLEGVWDKTLTTLNKGKDEIVRLSKMGKIKLDTQMMERDKNYLFQKLGEETYKGLKTDKLNTDNLKKYVLKIENLNKKIKTQDGRLDGLAKKAKTRKRKTTKKNN